MLLVVYGALVIAGASSPFLESKLITVRMGGGVLICYGILDFIKI